LKALNRFLSIESSKEVEDRFNEAKNAWNDYKNELESILLELKPYVTSEIFSSWTEILTTLETRISTNVLTEQMKPVNYSN
jgi:hypothetical protein